MVMKCLILHDHGNWCYWVCEHVEWLLPSTISPGPPTVVNTKEDMTDYEHHIDPDGVAKLLRSLQNGKAPGSDNLGKTDLMIDIKMTAKCLSLIYNKFIEQGELPLDWKTAHVTQVYKSGPQHSCWQLQANIPNQHTVKIVRAHIAGWYLSKSRWVSTQ